MGLRMQRGWTNKHMQQLWYSIAVKNSRPTGCKCFRSLHSISCRLHVYYRRYESSWSRCCGIKSKCIHFFPLKEYLIQRSVPRSASKYTIVPFPVYCRLLMQEKLNQRVCRKCHMYWSTKAAPNRHKPYHKENEKIPTTELQNQT